MQYTQEQLINILRFNSEDIAQIEKCRYEHNRLGFGYQLSFVRLLNRSPRQVPFEAINDILNKKSESVTGLSSSAKTSGKKDIKSRRSDPSPNASKRKKKGLFAKIMSLFNR